MKLYNKQELAEALGVSTRQINILVERGELPPGVRLGKKIKWHQDIVEKMLERVFEEQLAFEPRLPSPVGSARYSTKTRGPKFIQEFEMGSLIFNQSFKTKGDWAKLQDGQILTKWCN